MILDGIPFNYKNILLNLESQPHTTVPTITAWKHPAMKRISIAEQTLKKQIDLLYAQQRDLNRQVEMLRAQGDIYQRMILDLETEQTRLRTQRESASKRSVP